MKSYNHKIKTIIDRLRKNFKYSPIKDKIVCLIHHGSSLGGNFKTQSDIDLELILSKQDTTDYQIIKNIISKEPIDIEIQLRYLDELCNKHGLINITNYKLFMFFAYSNGKVLIGKNIYKKLVRSLTTDKIKKSFLISIQINYKDIRKSYFGSKDSYVINKNIMRFFQDICMYMQIIDFDQLGKKTTIYREQDAYIGDIINIFCNNLLPDDLKTLIRFKSYYKQNKTFYKIFYVVNKILYLFLDKININ